MGGLGVVSGDGVLFGAGGLVCSDAAHGLEAGVGTAVGTGWCFARLYSAPLIHSRSFSLGHRCRENYRGINPVLRLDWAASKRATRQS